MLNDYSKLKNKYFELEEKHEKLKKEKKNLIQNGSYFLYLKKIILNKDKNSFNDNKEKSTTSKIQDSITNDHNFILSPEFAFCKKMQF